ncbi:cytochrome P450 [Phytohabitans sp. ZYX-F-186]|uniref:Cytochrome P450 n=1 Tax=Phytohabitans maris TaxID=3071409 RepID=A0ABU0ZW50_9ACTN|nr:cytochrome P450 [Phytohabitans sp. ZYX-F-186]MDQ7911263.1 cytochrome P450 [Phytohabitans sp. ZYX-F-186]
MTADQGTNAGCPVVRTDYRIDRPVHEHYALLNRDREAAPILRAEFTPVPFWMVTRYADVLEALQEPDTFGNEVVNAMDPRRGFDLLPQLLDPPEHTKLRKQLNRFFSPAAVRRLEPLVVSHCAAMLDELAPRGGCDMVSDFAIRFPTDMFLATLGLPVEDGKQFVTWVEAVFAGFFGSNLQEAHRAWGKMTDYFDAALDDRLRAPRDRESDFLTHLVLMTIDGEPLRRKDMLSVCLTLMAAGLDTTRSALSYIFHHLATHPADRQLIVDDPARVPRAVEELLRLYPLVFQDGRKVRRDVDFHGCPMDAGDVVWLGLASANRDPRKFDDPDAFHLDRPNAAHHLSFGAGVHRCLGMHLARHELAIALTEWHRRIPHYEIATTDPIMERGGQLTLRSLPLRWDVG